jgi:hypothetical protein
LIPHAIEEENKSTQNEEDTINTIAQESPSFQITTNMLQIDDAIAQTPLKDLA